MKTSLILTASVIALVAGSAFAGGGSVKAHKAAAIEPAAAAAPEKAEKKAHKAHKAHHAKKDAAKAEKKEEKKEAM